jgi:uncharacterized protein (TIGR03067 family)
MKRIALITAIAFGIALPLPSITIADDDPKDALQGVWVAKSMKADGKPAPKEAVKRMRFTFDGDKLLMRGNSKTDDSEEEATYVVDAEPSPKHLDFTPPNADTPVMAIYEIKGDELKVCIRHAKSSEGRPTKFESKPNSRLVLIVFKKQKTK